MDVLAVRQNFLRRLSEVILKMKDLESFLDALTKLVQEVFSVQWVTLSLLDQQTRRYTLSVTAGSAESGVFNEPSSQFDQQSSWLKERQKIVSRRLMDDFSAHMTPELKDQLNKSDTWVSLPVFAGEQMVGVLNLGAKAKQESFVPEELNVLTELTKVLGAIVWQAVDYHTLNAQRQHHQTILDNLVSGIVVIDPQDKITVCNRAAKRILNIKHKEVLGREIHILPDNFAKLLLDTLHQGKTYSRQELHIMPENTLIGLSTSQFYDSQGKLLGACMVFRNLNEIKRQEDLARQKNMDVYWSNVATSIAHEVKNSILATKVFTEMFPQKYEDAEFRWSLYSALKRDMEKLNQFSEKVLNFAQTQEGLAQSCQMDKIIDAAVSSAIEEKDIGAIRLEKRYSPDVKPFLGDYHQLKEAFTQIISNAIETMGKQGKLSISVEHESSPQMLLYNLPEATRHLPEAEIIVVKISDTGSGIAPEHLPYLFDPFFTTKEARTGLGLTSARKIIEKHQGLVQAESKLGQGTTFWVVLPILPQPSKQS